MTSELKTLHPYLYKRVRLKGILFTALGLSSIFHTFLDHLFHTVRNTAGGINPVYTGLIFVILGVGILYGLYTGKDRYKLSRIFLYGSFIYAVFWEFVLILLAFTQHISTLSIFILWGYLTYNLFILSSDSAWAGAEIVKEVIEGGN